MKIRLIFYLIIIIFSCIFLTGCDTTTDSELIINSESSFDDGLFVWLVYWDLETAEKEVQELDSKIDGLSYFAGYFNSESQLILPNKLEEIHDRINKSDNSTEKMNYLTIVNDKVMKDGKSSLKDTILLYELLSDENTRKEHIKNIISLAKNNGYDGLEIDYEKIRSDIELWHLFLKFCEELNTSCENEGLEFRVILEPQTPFEKLEFPEGPDYVMMCYNLNGSHSDPGPKANVAFIEELIIKMELLPGHKNFALATGGNDWSSDGKVTSLTESDAQALLVESGEEVQRDIESGSLFFSFSDEQNIRHEVWFADATTLNGWINLIRSKGNYGISIWRLGGNISGSSIEL